MSYPLDRPESTDRDPRNDLRDWAEPTRERLDPYLDFPECPLESLDSLESSLLSLEAFLRLDFVDALLDRVDLVDFAESWPPPKPQPFPYLKKWKFEKIYSSTNFFKTIPGRFATNVAAFWLVGICAAISRFCRTFTSNSSWVSAILARVWT